MPYYNVCMINGDTGSQPSYCRLVRGQMGAVGDKVAQSPSSSSLIFSTHPSSAIK